MRELSRIRKARLALKAKAREAREFLTVEIDVGAYVDEITAARTVFAHERRRAFRRRLHNDVDLVLS